MNDRKPISPVQPMQVPPSTEKSETGLNRDIQIKIGQQLRAIYNDIVDQGIPDRFTDLLQRLDGGEIPGDKESEE